MELEALAKAASDIAALGASLVLISPQKIEHSRKMMKDKGLSAVMLSDPGNEIAAHYGLRYEVGEDLKKVYRQFNISLDEYNGDDSWTLPLPTTLIIDQNTIIRHGAINADYTVRPDPEETLASLKKIVA